MRVSLRGIAAIAGALAAAPALALAAPALADELPFTVLDTPMIQYHTNAQVSPIAPGFVGVSMEYCAVTSYTGATADPVLVNLIRNLAPTHPVLRVGGDSTDQTRWNPQATPSDLATRCPYRKYPLTAATTTAIGALAHTLGAKLILGINLRAHREHWAAAEVRALIQAIDPQRPSRYIEAFELGNEPDLYRRYAGAFGFNQFMQDFAAWAGVVRRAAGADGFGIAGPSLGRVGLPWITGANSGNLGTFVGSKARPLPVTFHAYPFLASGVCPGNGCPTIGNLLTNAASHQLAEGIAQFASQVPRDRNFRIDEMGAVTNKGRLGVSNTFAAALWALDTLFELASAGVDGVNVHTIPGASYELFTHVAPDEWTVHPEYYGLLMFARAAPAGSRLLLVTSNSFAQNIPSVKIWGVRSADGLTRIVVINKDTSGHGVMLTGPGLPDSGPVMLQRLQAAPATGLAAARCNQLYAATGLCATGGVSLGGRSFGPDLAGGPGGDETTTGLLAGPAQAALPRCRPSVAQNCVSQGSGTSISVALGPASAAMITLGPAPAAGSSSFPGP